MFVFFGGRTSWACDRQQRDTKQRAGSAAPSLLQVQRTPGLLLNVLKRTAAVWRFTCLKARFAVRGSKRTTLVFGQNLILSGMSVPGPRGRGTWTPPPG